MANGLFGRTATGLVVVAGSATAGLDVVIVTFCVEEFGNGFSVEFGREDTKGGFAEYFAVVVVGDALNLPVVVLTVVPLTVVVDMGFVPFDTVFRPVDVVGINLVVVTDFCVEVVGFGARVGRKVGVVPDLTVLVETGGVPWTVVTLIVVPLIVVVGIEFPIFPVVATILVVVVIFCVALGCNGLTGFGRKVVVEFEFTLPNGTETLCKLFMSSNNEIPIKINLNIL